MVAQPGSQRQPGPPSDADKTQVVSGEQMPPRGNDSTQVFGAAAGPSQDNSERTQVVTGFGGRQQFPSGPDVGQQGGSDVPPWAGSEFPPLGGAGVRQPESWYAQGPEVFDRRSGSKAKIFAIVGVVVVALLVGAFFVFKPFSGGNTPQAGPSTTRQAPPTTTTPAGPLVPVSGSPTPNAVHTFADAVALGFLTPEEVAAYQSGQPTTTYFSDTTIGTNQVLVLVVKTSGQPAAVSVTAQLVSLQAKYLLQPRTGGPVGVSIEGSDGAQGGPLRRAEYASGSYAVRIQVQGNDPVSADQELTSVLNAQLARLPAND